MDAVPRLPVTDSPWFWVFAFSLMALLALLVIGPKYGKRQSAMDRKYQARERIDERQSSRINPRDITRKVELADRRPFATPGETLVPLWPLAVVLLATALCALVMLFRGRRPLATASDEQPGSLQSGTSSP